LYATYYGGFGEDDHVDGGTSRFDKNGIVYQSVCASCNTTGYSTSKFPVTDGSKKGSLNCNNACFKFDLTNFKSDFIMEPSKNCVTSDVTFTNTSTGGVDFDWDLGDGTQVNGPGPIKHKYIQSGDYIIRLIATDLTTCISRDTTIKILHVYPSPLTGLQTIDTAICVGQTIVPSIKCIPSSRYFWTPNISISNNLSCTPLFSPIQTTHFFLTVVDSNSCVAKDSMLINVLQYFNVDFNPNTLLSCGPTNITFDNISMGDITNYEWSLGDGTKTNEFQPSIHYYNKPGTYKITLIGSNKNACIQKDTVEKTIQIFHLPTISISLSDTIICLGDTAKILNTYNPNYNYSWSPTEEILNPNTLYASFYPSLKKTYYLTITDQNSCKIKDSIIIDVANLVVSIGWENLTTCKGKPTVRLSNPSTGPLNYFWTFGDGSSSKEQSPIHEYNKGGNYPVVLNAYNDICSSTEVGVVKIDDIKIPNLFTPNQDGKNDCFEIVGLYPGWKVEVYNPWNSLVFKSDSYQNQFCADGLSTSVYYYLVCAPYGDCCKSWVHIISDK
jgi:PKD repeat protein